MGKFRFLGGEIIPSKRDPGFGNQTAWGNRFFFKSHLGKPFLSLFFLNPKRSSQVIYITNM